MAFIPVLILHECIFTPYTDECLNTFQIVVEIIKIQIIILGFIKCININKKCVREFVYIITFKAYYN